jgi:Xaa-Pro aminopeptidase
MRSIVLKGVELPDFGKSEEHIEIPPQQFEDRIKATVKMMKHHGLDFLLVFADREHTANLTYLTNLDPRFEEALLLLDTNGNRKMLLGNECMGYTGICPIPMVYEIYQEFSLMGQDRTKSRPLDEIISSFGIKKGSRVGCSYYKYSPANLSILDIPAFLADILREKTGQKELVTNASGIFMDIENGLRHHNSLEELVRYEWASTRTSDSLRNLLKQLKPGTREYELSRNYTSDGLPYSCHPMVSSGKKAAMGLSSPSGNKVVLKDAFTSAMGVWGALTARAGMVAKDAGQLDNQVAVYYEKFWKAYFATVVAWYENIGVGISAGDVVDKVEDARDKTVFDFALNTGHTLHLDEWVNSPFTKGSAVKLYSGMAMQLDIIPVSNSEFVCCNMEDGIVLADEPLRKDWATKFPDSWKRIQQRREFMINKIGIKIREDVMPLSNTPAYYSPYLLSPGIVGVCD